MTYRNPAASPAEEADEAVSIESARWTILHDGLILPVTTMFDGDGNLTNNPMHAYSIVCYNEHLTDGRWMTISNVDSGDIWSRQ